MPRDRKRPHPRPPRPQPRPRPPHLEPVSEKDDSDRQGTGVRIAKEKVPKASTTAVVKAVVKDEEKTSGKVTNKSSRAGGKVVIKKEKDVLVRLVLQSFELKEGKWPDKYKGWDMYFLFDIEDPRDANRRIATTIPSEPVKMKNASKNKHRFGSEGMEVYYGPLPKDGRVSATVMAIQDKGKTRSTGAALKSITGLIDKEVSSKAGAAAAQNPWVAAGVIANKGGNLAGKLLEKTKDKSRGTVTLDVTFDVSKFNNKWNVNGSRWTSSKEVKLKWRWTAEKK